ncbi:hypothetical protein MPTK1_4g13710 [Marchantia polymorpha subsp. ruderalis]|uniref:Uncharacterized protein n=2 Tax=Marchantia polymorpha TaxID=3197 RepID=A0AAF6B9L5_MARPO|nr:hypothetical protein MARPO_0202s0018 [Marchantia polymorpha]BBN08699.1 hypothetical protein Mp_4g13710 [Marchantia polymorpha subsp. ruderalis]|eukprot:PTQ27391.1 hypothetical protein MARPO_0202s0018 [Marchantia polymorpha]
MKLLHIGCGPKFSKRNEKTSMPASINFSSINSWRGKVEFDSLPCELLSSSAALIFVLYDYCTNLPTVKSTSTKSTFLLMDQTAANEKILPKYPQ